jgi:hypothetical protein
MTPERQLEDHLIKVLRGLKYEYRADIRDRAAPSSRSSSTRTIPTTVADCLSALDARIVAAADKLAALKTHKKGLMQQLVPLPEEG